jgi:hypothetical protein
LKELLNYLQDLCYNYFYGKVEISFEAGRVVHVKEIKNIKLKGKEERSSGQK